MQERVEIPGNLYFQKTSEKRLKSGKLKKNKTTFTLTTLIVFQESKREVDSTKTTVGTIEKYWSVTVIGMIGVVKSH